MFIIVVCIYTFTAAILAQVWPTLVQVFTGAMIPSEIFLKLFWCSAYDFLDHRFLEFFHIAYCCMTWCSSVLALWRKLGFEQFWLLASVVHEVWPRVTHWKTIRSQGFCHLAVSQNSGNWSRSILPFLF